MLEAVKWAKIRLRKIPKTAQKRATYWSKLRQTKKDILDTIRKMHAPCQLLRMHAYANACQVVQHPEARMRVAVRTERNYMQKYATCKA